MPNTGDSRLQTIGDYDLLAVVGEGSIGTVYRACQRTTGAIVAVKVMDPELAENPVLLKRFEQEFLSARTLTHPNLVHALAYGTCGEIPYLVMEFVEGESLGDRLARVGRLPEAEAVRLIVQVAQGLAQAHKRGLIHRDVKPDNILVTPSGQAKLTDLGLAKDLTGDLNLTRTGRGLGTPHFTAPEQVRDAKNADVPSDIYSLGATLYQLVTGEVPFKSCGTVEALHKKNRNDLTPVRALVPELSARLDFAIRRAMAAVPAKRPQSCQEFAQDLLGRRPDEEPAAAEVPGPQSPTVVTRVLDGEPSATPVAGTKPDLGAEEPSSRADVAWLLVGIAVGVVAVVLVLAFT